jgi:Fur family peroxide stress response transcriptional regulator
MFEASPGMKMTPQRMAIMDYLNGNIEHPSAAEVYRAISRKFPTMSFATVYNTLRILIDRGLLVELSLDPEKKRFDANPAPHHHLICVKCKKILDVMQTFDLSLPEDDRHLFQLIGNHVDFYGICPQCGTRESTDRPGKDQQGSSTMSGAQSLSQDGAKKGPL